MTPFCNLFIQRSSYVQQELKY